MVILIEYNLTSKCFSGLFYSPQNTILDRVMDDLALNLETFNPIAYPHASDLEHALTQKDAFVGVQFEDHLRNIREIPEKIKVALRFPQHLRSQEDAVWPNRLYRKINDEVAWKSDVYEDEGFLIVQMKLSEALIRMKNASTQIPSVYLQPFPDRAHNLYSYLINPFRHLITVFPFLFIASSLFISEVGTLLKKNKTPKNI